MVDYREEFLTKYKQSLVDASFKPEDINNIITLMLINIDKYELTPRCTEIAVLDSSVDNLLKMYAGCLLTEGKSKNTVKGYVMLIKRFYNEVAKQLTEVSVFDIRSWLAKQQSKVSLRTCENYRSYLSAFYCWMLAEGMIECNPMVKIKPIKFSEKAKLPFSDVEVDMLRGGCETLRDRALIEFLISSGARVTEACNVNIEDINFSTLEVIINEGKGGKSRKSYITPVCAAHIKNIYNRDQTEIVGYSLLRIIQESLNHL